MIKILSTKILSGENFEFNVYQENDKVLVHRVIASINNKEIYNKIIADCKEPPCYEWFQIPEVEAGSKLNVIYDNNQRNRKRFSFLIQEKTDTKGSEIQQEAY